MKAMILAAGLGKRMRPLTDHTPKPLLPVGGKPLIQYHIERLHDAGIDELIINLAYRGDQIREYLGDGSQFGVSIDYSEELQPLETAGAIFQALPLLGEEPFLLVNGDVWTDYPFAQLLKKEFSSEIDGYLVLVANPEFNPQGDFSLGESGVLSELEEGRYTYSGVSVLSPRMVAEYPQRREKFPLVEVFHHAIARGRLYGELYRGDWQDIGTPERLKALDSTLQ